MHIEVCAVSVIMNVLRYPDLSHTYITVKNWVDVDVYHHDERKFSYLVGRESDKVRERET